MTIIASGRVLASALAGAMDAAGHPVPVGIQANGATLGDVDVDLTPNDGHVLAPGHSRSVSQPSIQLPAIQHG